ncbi:MAG: hypothetical protein IJY65_05625 [Clostridia bacterium]|nr:hypothetical protein [Clostridia bacterium]
MDGLILEPLKYYTTVAREKHKSNLASHFDSLHSRSGVDAEANRKTVAEYDSECAILTKIRKRISGYKVGFGFLIALAVIGIIAAIVGIYLWVSYDALVGGLTLAGGVVAALVGFLVAFRVVRPKIRAAEREYDEHFDVAEKLLSEANAQMAPLNALFDNLDTLRLIEKTMPEVKFDLTYSHERERELIEDYDYIDMTDDETSVIDSLSGTLFENPFLFERYLSHVMGEHTYHGTLTISWTEYYRDSKGRSRTRRRTQVLHAQVTKPKPYYFTNTHLGYGSLVSPDLSFSRNESDTDELSERALARRIRRGERKLKKRAAKAISTGGSFQEMANSEFDVLFGAHDRDHEVQFRVMYTPLAQNNTVDLLRSKEGYGDDFNFIKQNRYNIIKSNHAQKWDMNLSAERYRSYSIDIARERFMTFNEEYFKSVFFDFAPLMAVPAYQDEPVHSMKEPRLEKSCYTSYEHEALANAIGESAFEPLGASTRSILKTRIAESSDGTDRVSVTAYSYRAEERVDLIPVLGGDGRMHAVPVPWLEYIPIQRTTDMAVKSLGHTEREFNEKAGGIRADLSAYLHGLMAYIPNADDNIGKINEYFKKYI